MNFAKSACATFVLLAASAFCSAQIPGGQQCSNATLNGNYAFTIVGQILAPAPAAGLVSGVALSTFDGQGGLSQVDHVLHNGIAPSVEWRKADATNSSYSVNPDCTGTMTIVFNDGSPTLHLEIVIDNNGKEVRTVVTQPAPGSPLQPAITSIGTKVFSLPLPGPAIQ